MLLRETFSCEDEKDPASEPYLFWRQALYSRRAAIIVDSDEVLAEEAWPAVYTWCCRLADAGHKLVLFARPEVRESLQSVLSGPDKAAVPPPTRLVELEIGPLPQPLQRAMAAARLGDELAEPFMRSFAGCEVITQHPYGLSVLLAVAERDGTEDKQRLPIDVMNLAAGAVLESTLKIGPKEREQCLAVLEVVALEIERQRPRDCVSSASILDVLHLEQPHLARLWGQLRDPICLGKTVLVQPGRPLPGEGPTIRFINSVFKDYFLARCYVRYTENGHFLGLPPFESMLMDPRWDTFFGYMLPIAELSELPFTVDVQSQSLDAAQVRQLVRHFSAWTQPLLRLVFGRGHVCDFSLLRDVLRDSGHTLQHLALRCNALGTPGAEVLAEWLRGETAQVWSLDLAHCSLGPEGVEALAAVLGGNKVLRDLDLSSNILRPEGAASLGEALRQNSAIERLHVDSNSLGGPGLVQLLSALRHNASLMLLSAASNRVGNDGAAAVAAALADGSAGEVLEELDLRNNEITGLGLQRLAGSLGARGALPSLRRLELAGNEIGPGGAFHLAAPLATISIGAPLTCLGLDHCMVTAEGAQSLARALAEGAACLSSVDLRGNRLGSAGARLLAAGMDTGKCKLRRLSIPGNGIGDEGTAALVAGMPGSLEELDLSENRIGAAGAQALARALLRPERNFLRSVWLVRNMLGPTGCEALAAVLGKRSRVENLQLAGNAVANAGAKAMAEALHRKPRRLAVLGLQSNHISASGIDALSKAAEQAPALERLCVEGNSAGEEWDPYLDNLIGAQTRLAATTRIQAAAAASAAAAAAEAAAAEDVEAAAASKEEDDGSSGLDAGSSLGSRLGGPAPRARGGRRGTVMQAAERRGSYVLLSEEVARRWSRLYQALTEAYAASPPPTTDAAATAVERRRRTVAVAASALRSGRMASK